MTTDRQSTPPRQSSRLALEACASFLVYCLSIGWDKSKLGRLQEIWWEHHDDQGRLV